MSSPVLQRMTAWFCLALTLLTGAAPAQGFVLCLEPDGCVSLEPAAASEQCIGCDDHLETGGSRTESTSASDDTACPCLDLPVALLTHVQRIQPQSIGLRIGAWLTLPVAVLSQELGALALAARAPPLDAPRPPDVLVLIRSVVLLV